jgi:hypothetical protein
MQYKHPFVCCKYPVKKIPPGYVENCASKCERRENRECCVIDCTYRETGVVFNGVFNEQALLRLYENYLEANDAGKYSPWLSVVEKSIHKCMETSDELSRLIDLSSFTFDSSLPLFSAENGEDLFVPDSRIRHRHNRLRKPRELPQLPDLPENRTV